MDIAERRLEVCLDAINRYGEVIKSRISHQYQFISFSLVALSLYLSAVAIAWKNPFIVMGALGCFGPITIATFGALLSMEVAFIRNLGLHVGDLEKEVNRLLGGEPVLIWSSRIMPKYHRNRLEYLMPVIGYGFFITLMVIAGLCYLNYQAEKDLPYFTKTGYDIVVVSSVLISSAVLACGLILPKTKVETAGNGNGNAEREDNAGTASPPPPA